LTKKSDYTFVFENAGSTRDRYFTILWRPSAAGITRLGLAISKKYLKKATDRNRIKRLIRESFRKNGAILPKIDIIVLAGQSIGTASSNEVNTSLLQQWSSIINKFKL